MLPGCPPLVLGAAAGCCWSFEAIIASCCVFLPAAGDFLLLRRLWSGRKSGRGGNPRGDCRLLSHIVEHGRVLTRILTSLLAILKRGGVGRHGESVLGSSVWYDVSALPSPPSCNAD